MQANQKPVIWTVVIATVLLLIAGLFSVGYISSNVNPTEVDEDAIVEAVLAGIVIPEPADTFLSVGDYKDSLAEELATVELENNDFLELLIDKMNLESGIDIEDEEDVVSFRVSDVDVTGTGTERDVIFTLVVKYFNDGDDEEEDMEKAKVEVTYKVSKLVRADDYEDAKSDDDFYDFKLVKVYN